MGRSSFATGNGDIIITSSGSISSSDDGIFSRIYGTGDITISSTGYISSHSEGIYGRIRDGTGDVSTTDENAEGLFGQVEGNGNVVIASTGNVSTNGIYSEGIFGSVLDSGNLTITSIGEISTAQSAGILADVDGTGAISIYASGSVNGATGIQVDVRDTNAPVTITSSALITGTDGTAINLRGNGHDVVNLLAGSVIDGALDFGNGNDGMGDTNDDDIDTLNVASGVNAVINFADAGSTGQGDDDLQSAPENINILGGAGVLIDGGETLVVVDPTGFAAQTDLLADLLKTTFNMLDNEPPVSDGPSGLA